MTRIDLRGLVGIGVADVVERIDADYCGRLGSIRAGIGRRVVLDLCFWPVPARSWAALGLFERWLRPVVAACRYG